MFFLILGYKREHIRIMSTPCIGHQSKQRIYSNVMIVHLQRLCSLKIHTMLGSKETYQTKYK